MTAAVRGVDVRAERVAPHPARTRVADVHAQARPTLGLAAGFAVAAAVATVVPHDTGSWLPLHLFLVGSLLAAISGATQLFAVTWAAGPAPSTAAANVQRTLVAAGALGVAGARELDLPAWAVALAATSVVAGLVVLAVLLVRIVRAGSQRRFDAPLRTYLAALGCGVAGSLLGAGLAVGSGGLRTAHVTLNLLGLVGLVIAGTLPFFAATQARSKTSPRWGPRADVALAVLLASVAVAAAGVRAGYGAYAAGLALVATMLPPVTRKQLGWAGPRLVQLYAGLAWWAVAAGWFALDGIGGRPLLVLVVGGYAQILVASLAYLGPVLRGGGHVRLARGFARTRSWESLVLLNAGAVAAAAGASAAAAACALGAGLGVGLRGVALARLRDDEPAAG